MAEREQPRPTRTAGTGLVPLLALVTGLLTAGARAQDASSSSPPPAPRSADEEAGANGFGMTGVGEIPSARIAPGGIVEAGVVARAPFRRAYLRLSPFDWLEVGYRFDVATNVLPDGTVLPLDQGRFLGDFLTGAGHPTLKDRSFDLKIRLWEEGRIRPAFAVGFQDIFGRAAFGGEYFVLTKRIGDLDFTAGLGFGYLGSRDHFGNPFSVFSNRYKRRDPDPAPGSLNLDSFFRGTDVALFGGVEWFTPIDGLSLSVSYAGRDLEREPFGIGASLRERLPIDLGLRWRPAPWFDVGLGLLGGRYLSARASLRFDAHAFSRPFEKRPEDPYPLAGAGSDRGAAGESAATDEEETLRSWLATRAIDPAVLLVDALEATLVLRRDAAPPPARWPELAAEAFRHLPERVRRLAIRREDQPVGAARVFLRPAVAERGRALAALGARELRLIGERAAVPGVPAAAEAALLLALPQDITRLDLAAQGRPAFAVTAERRARALARAAIATTDRDVGALALTHDGTLAMGVADADSGPAPGLPPLVADAIEVDRLVTLPADALAEADEPGRIGALFAALREADVEAAGLSASGERWTLWVTDGPPARPARLLGRALKAMAQAAPRSVIWLEVARKEGGGEAWRVEVLRRDVVQALAARGSPVEVATHAAWLPPRTAGPFGTPVPPPDYRPEDARRPAFSWGILPSWQAGVGRARDGLIRGDLYLDLVARLVLAGRIRLEGTIRRFLIGNLDELAPPADRALPAVRSDIAAYSRQGHNAIASATASFDWNWAPGLTSRISAGLYEPMYGGFGIETTWHEPLSRWLVYGELFWVKQRGFGQGLSFRDYSTVTGSLGLLYALDGGLTMDVSFNRYLAGDTGLRLEVTRRLDNGLQIGAWLAGSSRSDREFGRSGNLDKGLFVRIPLDGFWPFAAPRETVTTRLANLLRDSGQRLQLNERLYERIFASDPRRILEDLPDLFY